MAIWQWSKTATNNSTADPTISWPEGMPPASVDDSARAMMARTAEWRDDTAGILADTGTASAYVVTSFEGVQTPTPTDGTRISFVPANTNNSSVTLAVDGGSAFPIQAPSGTGIPAGTMVALTPYDVVFRTATNTWILKGVFGVGASPNLIPLGGMIDYTGSSAPNSNFVLPFGQAISRTTYAAYFALVGTTYGVGDGSTTFTIADCRGVVVAGLDNMGGSAAGRLTPGSTLGAIGGEQNHTLVTGEMPSHNHTDSGHAHTYDSTASVGYQAGATTLNFTNNTGSGQTTGTASAVITNTGGGGAHNNVQPTVTLNKILRVL